MTTLRIFLAILLLPLAAPGDDLNLPDPPSGQVLDPGGWLDPGLGSRLDSELTRFRQRDGVEVLVVIWPQAVPDGTDLDALARRLGETWNRGNLWAVVLQPTNPVTPAVAAWGGAGLDSLSPSPALTQALNEAVARGRKEWSDQERASGIALNLGEDLVFLQLRHRAALAHSEQEQATAATSAKQLRRSVLIRAVLITLAALIALALGAAAWLQRRRAYPSVFLFPQTLWHRRLGAPWSGGSKLVASFTPPGND